MILRLLVVLAAAALGGCLAVPVPAVPHNIAPAAHARPGDKEVAEIREGVTTRGEVLLKLGEPDRVWERERVFQYRGTRVGGYVVVMFFWPSPPGGFAMPLGHQEQLMVQFDERGVVRRHKVITPLLHVPPGETAEAWLAEATSPGPSGSGRPPPPGG